MGVSRPTCNKDLAIPQPRNNELELELDLLIWVLLIGSIFPQRERCCLHEGPLGLHCQVAWNMFVQSCAIQAVLLGGSSQLVSGL